MYVGTENANVGQSIGGLSLVWLSGKQKELVLPNSLIKSSSAELSKDEKNLFEAIVPKDAGSKEQA